MNQPTPKTKKPKKTNAQRLKESKIAFLNRIKRDLGEEFEYSERAFENQLKNPEAQLDKELKDPNNLLHYFYGKLAVKNFISWALKDIITEVENGGDTEETWNKKNN